MSIKITYKLREMGRWQKLIIAVAAFFAFYSIFGFLILPFIVKSVSTRLLSEKLYRKTTIEGVGVNPYVLSLRMKGLKVQQLHSTDRFAAFDNLYLNLQAVSLFKWGLVVKEFDLNEPYLKVIRTATKQYNLSDLFRKKEGPAKKKGSLWRFSMNNIRISNGEIEIQDIPKDKVHKITHIRLDIPRLSDFSVDVDVWVKPAFSAEINQSPVAFKGETKPFSKDRNSILDMSVKDVNLPYYMPYLPRDLGFDVTRGTLSLDMKVKYEQTGKTWPPGLDITGGAWLNNLEAVDKKEREPFIRIPSLSVSDVDFDLSKKDLTVPKLESHDGEIFIKRNRNGEVNLRSLFPVRAGKGPADRTLSSGKGTAWQMKLQEGLLKGYTVSVSDLKPDRPLNLTLRQVSLQVNDLSREENRQGSLSLSGALGEKGQISAQGTVGVSPAYGNFKLDLTGIDVAPLESYFPGRVKVGLKKGSFSASGNLLAGYSKAHKMTMHYLGKASLSDFVSTEQKGGQNLIQWQELQLKDIDAQTGPPRLSVREVGLKGLDALVVIDSDGKLNLIEDLAPGKKAGATAPSRATGKPGPAGTAKVVVGPEAKTQAGALPQPAAGSRAAAAGPSGQSPAVKINKVLIENGRIDFSDSRIQPPFKADFTDLAGTVLGLSSEKGTQAEVDLQGRVNGQSPLEIKGKVSPLSEDLYVKANIQLKNMGLTPLNPYAEKYIGYSIEKGKLFLNLQYLIVKRKLDSENGFLLDQLTFGNQVENSKATSIPVKFVVALLKNREGQIKLDVPVTGNINDPKFSLGGIILKTIKSFVLKAMASPFALLGKIFGGGGEELRYVVFPYGSSALTKKAEEKLGTLTKALHDRPGLNLDVAGYVDVQQDKEALQQDQFMKKLKTEKLKELVERGESNVSLDQVNIDPGEYGRYLRMAYDDLLSEKKGRPKGKPALSESEMKQALLAKIKITQADLRLLAQQRSQQVEKDILASGEIKPERVYLVSPDSLSPPGNEELKASRVILTLK